MATTRTLAIQRDPVSPWLLWNDELVTPGESLLMIHVKEPHCMSNLMSDP